MVKKIEPSSTAGRYAYDGLDRIMHEKARLGILASLVARPEGLVFGELKELCALTDGNLSRHLQVLEEAGLVEVWKGYHRRRPQTLCRLSREGRERFMAYLAELERVIQDAARVASREVHRASEGGANGNLVDEGWAPA